MIIFNSYVTNYQRGISNSKLLHMFIPDGESPKNPCSQGENGFPWPSWCQEIGIFTHFIGWWPWHILNIGQRTITSQCLLLQCRCPVLLVLQISPGFWAYETYMSGFLRICWIPETMVSICFNTYAIPSGKLTVCNWKWP